MIGIYKITSPTNKIYIGQSVNIQMRFYRYRKLQCKGQIKLYRSLLKHGHNSHKFEIIEECFESELHDKEIFYISLFNSTHFKTGLNCKEGGVNGRFTEETKKKMSESAKKRPPSAKGIKWSDESKSKLSKSKKGMTSSRKGCVVSIEQKELLRNYQLGIKQSDETKRKRVLSSKGKINCKKLIDEKTGVIYNSITDASELLGYKKTTLNAMLTGQSKNKTNLKYY